jgi:signal peptidase I
MNPTTRKILREAVALAATVLIVLAARSSLADHYWVPSGSMQPTVQIGDHLLVNKLAYGLRLPFTGVLLKEFDGPQRGEVVVLESPEDGEVLLKRVAALPGDRIAVRGGRLILDGRPVPVQGGGQAVQEQLGERLHPLGTAFGGGPDFGPATVPARCYLVLGDNRGNSRDGRFFGFVRKEAILGRAVGVLWRDGRPTWQGL